MQDRRPIKRRQRRFRKRILFAMAFAGFSVLFHQSALTFKQDRIAAAVMTAPHHDSLPHGAGAVSAATVGSDSKTVPYAAAPLQGPVAVGLAFRINRTPGLDAAGARRCIRAPAALLTEHRRGNRRKAVSIWEEWRTRRDSNS